MDIPYREAGGAGAGGCSATRASSPSRLWIHDPPEGVEHQDCAVHRPMAAERRTWPGGHPVADGRDWPGRGDEGPRPPGAIRTRCSAASLARARSRHPGLTHHPAGRRQNQPAGPNPRLPCSAGPSSQHEKTVVQHDAADLFGTHPARYQADLDRRRQTITLDAAPADIRRIGQERGAVLRWPAKRTRTAGQIRPARRCQLHAQPPIRRDSLADPQQPVRAPRQRSQ